MILLIANLYNTRGSIGSFLELLDARRPDIVGCVEVGTAMASALSDRFEHGVVDGDDDDYRGQALLSSSPIDVTSLTMPHRSGLRATIELDGVPTELMLAHLANPIDGLSGFRHRSAQVREILRHVDRVGTPAVLAGDLNATPIWPAYLRLRRRFRDGVRDAERAASRMPRRTWAPRPGLPPMLRIDHILTAGVRLDDVQTHRVAGSDHVALSARMTRVRP